MCQCNTSVTLFLVGRFEALDCNNRVQGSHYPGKKPGTQDKIVAEHSVGCTAAGRRCGQQGHMPLEPHKAIETFTWRGMKTSRPAGAQWAGYTKASTWQSCSVLLTLTARPTAVRQLARRSAAALHAARLLAGPQQRLLGWHAAVGGGAAAALAPVPPLRPHACCAAARAARSTAAPGLLGGMLVASGGASRALGRPASKGASGRAAVSRHSRRPHKGAAL